MHCYVIGSINGSNIFNIFLILVVSSLIRPLGYDASFNTDLDLLVCLSIRATSMLLPSGAQVANPFCAGSKVSCLALYISGLLTHSWLTRR